MYLSMCCWDVHTHRCGSSKEAIRNVILGREPMPEGEGACSVGIHPWFIPSHWQEELGQLAQLLAEDRRIVAIGECGLDSLASAELSLQREVLVAQVLLAEKWKLPMLLHVVKTHSELLAVRKQLSARMPWVIHGFRGKPELARQYVAAGCYLSFGARFNPAVPPMVPADRILLETDESEQTIDQIAACVAQSCQIDVETLKHRIVSNTQRLFFGHRDCLFG